MADAGGSMTLVFERAALEWLADPAVVFTDARQWTEILGLVSDGPSAGLSAYADRAGIDPDLVSSARGRTGGLSVIRQQYPTDRHVFVGTTEEDRQLAESLGWEFQHVAEAAAAADWTLAEDAGRWQGNDEG